MQARAVLFDLFDTLVPGQPAAVWRQTYTDMAAVLEVEDEPFHAAWYAAFEDRMTGKLRDTEEQIRTILRAVGEAASDRQIEEAVKVKQRFLMKALQPRHDTLHTLDGLRSRGLSLGLVTDCSWEAPRILDEGPLGPFFSARACSALLGTRKPDPRMYLHVLEQLGLPPEACLYVGDGNSHELLGARQLGMTTVWVDNGSLQQFKERWSPDGDHSVQQLAELLPIVDRLLG
jgi:putative hydrolase of the HAD superfamily